MNAEQEIICREGYGACIEGTPEHCNPYTEQEAEYWSDGWEDAKEDALS